MERGEVKQKDSCTQFPPRRGRFQYCDEQDSVQIMIFPHEIPQQDGSLGNHVTILDRLDHVSLEIKDDEAYIKNSQGRTILETWSLFASAVGAMPYWISNEGSKSKIRSSTSSKVSF